MKRSPILGYNHNVRYAGRLWHIQTEDSGVSNPRIFTHLFHEGTILATKRSDYDATLEVPAVQKLMQGQHKQLLRELKDGAFDEKIERFFGHPIQKIPGEETPALVEPPSLPPPTAAPVDYARASTLMVESPSPVGLASTTSPIDAMVMGLDDGPLPGPMTDPSMPAVVLPIAEPADFTASADDDDAEITIEPGAPQQHIAPELTPIPPVPSMGRSPSASQSMSNLPRQPAAPRTPSSPNLPRFPSSPVIPAVAPPRTMTPAGTRQPTASRTTTPSGSPARPAPTTAPTPVIAPRATTPPRNPVQPLAGRIPSQPAIRAESLRSPSAQRAAVPPPSTTADDPLSQIPLFAAPAPQAPAANPPRRDATATPLRVPTRPAAPSRSDLPPPRRPSSEHSIYPRRQSQTHGVVKPTSEGVVVARPAVVIGGNAPPAQAQRGNVSRAVPNRWHQQGPGQPPQQGAQQPGGKGFGSDLISERSLDEVILAYLSEDAKEK